MNGKFYPLFILTAVFIFSGCKTASKLYEKGDYDQAVELAVKKLQKKPDDPELIRVLQSAYKYAVHEHEKKIRIYSDNSSELKYEWICNEYAALQKLYNAIYHSPRVYIIVKPTDYSSHLSAYREKAGDVYFERGLRWMEYGDKVSFRKAFYDFQKALDYKPGDFQILQVKQEAYENALTHVVVLPIADYRESYRFGSYNSYTSDNFGSALLRNLRYHNHNQFVKFYSSGEARSKNIEPDQLMDIRFSSFHIGRTRDEKKVRDVSRQVIVKEIVYRPDSVVKEYATVHAKITTTQRSMLSEGNLQITIRDGNGRRLWSDNLNGSHRWVTEFSTFTGDERALSDSDKQLINRRAGDSPDEWQIMQHIFNEIQNNLYHRVRDYYSRYEG